MVPHGCANTAVGRRDNNEDRFCVEPELGLFAVADGIGGAAGGEVASSLVIDTMVRALSGTDAGCAELDIARAIELAGREVARSATGELVDMGTTLAALLVRGDAAVVAHVGDSRVYRLRDGELEQLTRDHSLVCDMVDMGFGRLATRMQLAIGNVVTRAICAGAASEPDVRIEPVCVHDRFLLCSDGVTDVLDPLDIREILTHTSRETASEALVDKAFDLGSADNLTAVVVDIEGV